MRDNNYEILSNNQIAEGTYLLTLRGDISEVDHPGLFINIKIDGCFLRRPMSVAGIRDGNMLIVYKVVGKGTEKLSKFTPGEYITALCPLGNGYNMEDIPEGAVITGGGAGVVPMYFLAEELVNSDKNPKVILGFNTKSDIIFQNEFESLGVELSIMTMDGSYGKKGFVTDVIEADDYVCACGPEPMLKVLAKKISKGQYDLSARMACGFGACMGCTVITKDGPKRVCKEGPVFSAQEAIW